MSNFGTSDWRQSPNQQDKNEQAEVSVAAIVGPVTASTSAPEAHRRVRFGSVEPAILALLKQLDPVVVVATLFGCMFVCGEQLLEVLRRRGDCSPFVVSWTTFGRIPFDSSIVTAAGPRCIRTSCCSGSSVAGDTVVAGVRFQGERGLLAPGDDELVLRDTALSPLCSRRTGCGGISTPSLTQQLDCLRATS